MAISKLHELYVMLGSAVCGAVLAFVFDIFRSLRKCFKFSDKAVAFQDLMYWIISLVIIYCAIYFINYAQLRIYEFLCMGLGAWCYIAYASRFCTKIMCAVFGVIAEFILYIFGFVSRPLKFVKCKVKALIIKTVSPIWRKITQFYKKLTKTTHKQGVLRAKFCKFFHNS